MLNVPLTSIQLKSLPIKYCEAGRAQLYQVGPELIKCFKVFHMRIVVGQVFRDVIVHTIPESLALLVNVDKGQNDYVQHRYCARYFH